ncbi:MAG: alpha-glucosidase C-terminal domain-containing protein [Gammaproteobacteria bacterium]|nr:alpha-glucosidase C-terminal domain-containing protein [Gammaproteobacteria bacterium]
MTGCATQPDSSLTREGVFQPRPYVTVEHPAWARNAAIYQINTRQFTSEGSFAAAEAQLPRIAKLGADIIWLMPIHPIGEKKRKGSLGSPYAVRDYFAVNPEFGTLDDFRSFVDTAHRLGMYVIIDWVANHTAWDNPMIVEHPEWYTRDANGEITHTTGTDWTDIADLDYSHPGLRRYMTAALEFWVRDVGIDGYRCDVAGYVPLDFWNTVRRRLDAIKPVFMLAEWESRDMHGAAFDATYAWSWNSMLHQVARGDADAGAIRGWYFGHENIWPYDAWRMTFVSNHDKNTWEGTQFELFGDALEAAIVLSVVGEGMPLLYNGQEAGNTKRLEFFERDPIAWREHPIGELYRQLFALLEDNTALWHGWYGAPMTQVANSSPQAVYSFVRRNESDSVVALFNFSAASQSVTLDLPAETYRDYFSSERVSVDQAFELAPWSYRVLTR